MSQHKCRQCRSHKCRRLNAEGAMVSARETQKRKGFMRITVIVAAVLWCTSALSAEVPRQFLPDTTPRPLTQNQQINRDITRQVPPASRPSLPSPSIQPHVDHWSGGTPSYGVKGRF